MAISFNVGVNWCHDFPKLAKESGFYFNARRPRVRIDWDRISSINIDRVVQQRDFKTIDENIKNVINCCLENEYDVNILDSNFVKLFRIAQLAVEYLLYCKQYLDHSVVILKDELRIKIEDNVQLKKEVTSYEDTIRHLREKNKGRSKFIEAKISDSQGEIHKCPHCPKTFVSATFVNAHIVRRHPQTDTFLTSTPVHDHYRAETEKLHNEIKALKERLNQTERIISNDSFKLRENISLNDKKIEDNSLSSKEKDINTQQHQHVYEEEINNLKDILFNEIRNLKQRDVNLSSLNVRTLIEQQEKEIQRLRNELSERLTPDMESMRAKLHAQEDFWKTKLEHIEYQHHVDIERLTSELKLTQNAAEQIKTDYKKKVNDLEEKSLNQSKILIQQNEQLLSLSNNIHNAQTYSQCNGTLESMGNRLNEHSDADVPFVVQSNKLASQGGSELKHSVTIVKNSVKVTGEDERKVKTQKSQEVIPTPAQRKIIYKVAQQQGALIKRTEKSVDTSLLKNQYRHTIVSDVDTSSKTATESSTSESSSPSSLDSLRESDSVGEFASKSERIISESGRNNHTADNWTRLDKASMINEIKEDLKEAFYKRLRDLGLDPEWEGIPAATFEQKIKIMQHHQNINAKKIRKYAHLRTKIMKEVLHRISVKQQQKDAGHLSYSVKATTSPSANRSQHSMHETKKYSSAMIMKEEDADSPQSTTKEIVTDNKLLSEKVQDEPTTILKDTIPIERFEINDSDTDQNININNDIALVSPKGVLKSATGSMGSLVKKKVLFDLDSEECKEESNVTDESVSRYCNREVTLSKEKSLSTGNIVLKNNQSQKILEISRRIENKLNMSRRKPAGAVETVFLAHHKQNVQPHYKEDKKLIAGSATDIALNAFTEQDSKEDKSKSNKSSVSVVNLTQAIDTTSSIDQASLNDSDLEADINEILQLT